MRVELHLAPTYGEQAASGITLEVGGLVLSNGLANGFLRLFGSSLWLPLLWTSKPTILPIGQVSVQAPRLYLATTAQPLCWGYSPTAPAGQVSPPFFRT
jgi:hypothetical protein